MQSDTVVVLDHGTDVFIWLEQIFDKSALEIKYPFKRSEINNEDDCRASQKRKAYSSFDIGSTSCFKKHKGKQVNTTLERAKEFKTCNPSFVVVMGASYVGSRFLLTIPCMFGKTQFDMDKKKGYIYFQVYDRGLVWPAKNTNEVNTDRSTSANGIIVLRGAELVADEGKSAAALAACRKNFVFQFPAFKVHSHVDIYHFDDGTWGGSFDMPKEMAHSHLRMVTDARYIYIVNGQYDTQCRGPLLLLLLDADFKPHFYL